MQVSSRTGTHNVVSSPTDAHWTFIRKTLAPSFSMASLKWVLQTPFLGSVRLRDTIVCIMGSGCFVMV